jgi:hypothetical protein
MIMLINLMPHKLNIQRSDGTFLEIPANTQCPVRVAAASFPAPEREGVPCVVTMFGYPINLPDPVDGVTLIVSGMVLDAVMTRYQSYRQYGASWRESRPEERTPFDLASPGDAIRDTEGNITGCRGLRVGY